MLFYFEYALNLLSKCCPFQLRAIDKKLLSELKYAEMPIDSYRVEVEINLNECLCKRDAILSSSVWNSEYMKAFCFTMMVGSYSQTILLPTEKSLELINFSGVQKEEASTHDTELANSPMIVSLGKVFHNRTGCYDSHILFGCSCHGNESNHSHLGLRLWIMKHAAALKLF